MCPFGGAKSATGKQRSRNAGGLLKEQRGVIGCANASNQTDGEGSNRCVESESCIKGGGNVGEGGHVID